MNAWNERVNDSKNLAQESLKLEWLGLHLEIFSKTRALLANLLTMG
jgi:hypothetical protein